MATTRREKGGDGPVIIKKYANRRLYNTSTSSYVTLDHLSEMVREDVDFVVYDAKTGEDITRSVLAQIIFEAEGKGQNMLPVNFLRQLISFYGDSLQGLLPSYLDMSMDAFSKNSDEMRSRFGDAMGAPMKQFEEATRRNMQLFEQAMNMFNPFMAGGAGLHGGPRPGNMPEPAAGAAASEPKTDSSGGARATDDLARMKDQLAAMQAQLEQLSGKK